MAIIDQHRFRFVYPPGFTTSAKQKHYPFLHNKPLYQVQVSPEVFIPPPALSSNLLAWFDPGQGITLLGDTVSVWLDSTGNANHTMVGGLGGVTQEGAAGFNPTYHATDGGFNGRPSLEFKTYPHMFFEPTPLDYMHNPTPWSEDTTNLTYYYVIRKTPGGALTKIIDTIGCNKMSVSVTSFGAPGVITNTEISVILWCNLVQGGGTVSTGNANSPSVGNSSPFDAFGNPPWTYISFAWTTYTAGFFPTVDCGTGFYLAYVLIYNGSHNLAERTQVMNALGAWFGITIS
jgi:hypothetical protein